MRGDWIASLSEVRMVSLNPRRAPKSIAAVMALVLAAFTTPVIAELNADDDSLLNQIQEILSRDGPYSAELLEPLSRLGLLYQEGEDYALALVTLERAQ